ncbi:MAG TPA: DUF2752 domain-containing protein, partial [Methylomirabilota bacterium]|nr:DUF2752 domain-containing protein [Methylomirabilota bacterium]
MKPDPIKSPPGQDTTCDGALRWRAGRRTLLANRPFLVALALGASALVVLYSVPPQQSSLYPRCLLHQWTGWQCPGCGGLRAAHELLHGRVLQAFHLNALCVLALPIASLYAL